MKINTEKLIKNGNNVIHHLVIHGLTETLKSNKEWVEFKKKNWDNKKNIDIKLTVGDQEINIESFCNHWEKQVEKMITNKANELIKDKFTELKNTIFNLEEIIEETIKKFNGELK